MEKNVRMIAISGQPLSGKSTAIDEMKKQLIEKGIKEENIHIVSVGKLFREYFNNIMELASNAENPEKFEEIATQEDMKRIFSRTSPYRESMLEALGKLSRAKFDFSKYDIEMANNSEELKEIRDIIDTIVDNRTAEIGKEVLENNNPDEVWIFDSRLAFSKIPEAFAVRLTVRDDIAGERLFHGTRKRGREDNNYASVEEARKKAIQRGLGEEKRYKDRYNVELGNEQNYDLIIDTSFSDVADIASTILECEELDRKKQAYTKRWKSPKMFLPMQDEMSTLRQGFGQNGESGMTIDEIIKSIRKKGYDPSNPIEVFEYENRLYIYEGHHRNFGAAYAKKTLVPYEIVNMPEINAKSRANSLSKSILFAHEQFFDTTNPDGTVRRFSYNEVFPGIFKEIDERNAKSER